jgi:hypothetical protein
MLTTLFLKYRSGQRVALKGELVTTQCGTFQAGAKFTIERARGGKINLRDDSGRVLRDMRMDMDRFQLVEGLRSKA